MKQWKTLRIAVGHSIGTENDRLEGGNSRICGYFVEDDWPTGWAKFTDCRFPSSLKRNDGCYFDDISS